KPPQLAEVQLVDLKEDIAMVHIVTAKQSDGQLYRQTRFYRHTTVGWQRTTPREMQWGTLQHLESSYFIFEYRRRDSAVVAKVAPQLDMLYTRLVNDFGLSNLLQQ